MGDTAQQISPVTVTVHVDRGSGNVMPGLYLCMSGPSGERLVLELTPAFARNVADLLACAAEVVEGGTPAIPAMRAVRQ